MSPSQISLNERQLRILTILKENGEQDTRKIAELLGPKVTAREVEKDFNFLKEKNILLKFKPLINWDKVLLNQVKALIEVKVTPQRGHGFDRIAGRIYSFPEVVSCYLVSGAYDLLVLLEGSTLQEIAEFVAEKLSTLDSVVSTVTHFMLKKYKEDGDILIENRDNDERLAIIP